MKKTIILFAAVLMIAGFSTKAIAQTSATVTGTTAGAQLIIPMAIGQDSPLHFGTINLVAGVGGTVVLSTVNAARSFTGGVVASAVTPLATNAAYHVTGTKNESYALTLPATITVTETVGNSASMVISDLKARFLGAADDAVISTLSATGTDSFTVGGTLTVSPSQVGGIYAGAFNVTVDYN
jgi:hypothetical protein